MNKKTLLVLTLVLIFFASPFMTNAQEEGSTYELEKVLLEGKSGGFGLTDYVRMARWTGKYFVLGGGCSSDQVGKGGLYVFTAEGNLVEKRSACEDSGNARGDLHSWEALKDIHVVDETHFVADLSGDQFGGGDRSPAYYEITPNEVKLVSKPFPGGSNSEKTMADFGLAVFDDHVIGTERRFDGDRKCVSSTCFNTPKFYTILYSLPSFNEVSELTSIGQPVNVGLNDVVVAKSTVFKFSPENQFTAIDEMKSGLSGYRAFPRENKIIALSDANKNLNIYELRPEGFELVETKNEDATIINAAIGGDYLAYIKKSELNEGKIIVWKGDERFEIPLSELPSRKREGSSSYNQGVQRNVMDVAITETGDLVVATFDAAFLYKDTQYDSPTDPSDDPSESTTELDINAIMRQYGITPLRDYNFQDTATNYSQSFSDSFFGSNDTNTLQEQSTQQNTYTLNRPPETIAEIRAFQCAYNIVCEGSISTTGYGNLGPKTQAKINEVFGTGDVNGAQTQTMTIQEMQELIAELLQQVAELQAQLNN